MSKYFYYARTGPNFENFENPVALYREDVWEKGNHMDILGGDKQWRWSAEVTASMGVEDLYVSHISRDTAIKAVRNKFRINTKDAKRVLVERSME